MPGIVSKLSGTTKNFTTGLMSDPQKMENLISMVRTVTPLTSAQTVTKVNTYLPLFEKVSTLLGMYSFLNRAQTFKPIEPMNAKSPGDMMTALMKNGNIPMGKLLAQPLISNNIEKIMGSMATNMIKNGGINDMLKNGNLNDILNNGNINDMLSAFGKSSGKDSPDNGNIDLNSLMETFMPIISSMNTNSSDNSRNENEYDENYSSNHDTSKNIELRNEACLPDDETDSENGSIYENLTDNDKYEHPKNERYDKNHRSDRYESYDKAVNYNDNKNNYREKDFHKPIRIKQRKRR